MRRFLTVIVTATVVIALGGAPAVAAGDGGGHSLEPTKGKKAPRTADYHRTLKLALADIPRYWASEYETVYGERYRPVKQVIAVRPGVRLPKCGRGASGTYNDVKGNAFYCSGVNFVAYDDAELFPELFRDFGEFSLPLVLAHEWGHKIQDLSGNTGQPTILKELQADCFAGTWVKRVADGEARGISLKSGNLDQGLAALLKARDTPGRPPDDQSAHGAAFDRVSAFQQGYEEGAETCAGYFDSPPVIVEKPFTTAEELASGGNAPAAQVIPATVDALNSFYTQVEPGYQPKTIDDVKKYDSSGSSSQLPECGGSTPPRKQIKNRVFYCIDDGYFAFDEPYLQHVYDDIGDFGVTTLLANTWATYVQTLQDFPGVAANADNAVLGADCYTGGFAAAIFRGLVTSDTLGGTFELSPGDLDETLQAFIDYASARGVATDIDVTFTRLHAFRDGFLNGYQVCQPNYANSNVSLSG